MQAQNTTAHPSSAKELQSRARNALDLIEKSETLFIELGFETCVLKMISDEMKKQKQTTATGDEANRGNRVGELRVHLSC